MLLAPAAHNSCWDSYQICLIWILYSDWRTWATRGANRRASGRGHGGREEMRGEAVEDEGVGEVMVTQAGMGRGEAGHRGHQAGQGGHGGRVTHGGADHGRRGPVMGGRPGHRPCPAGLLHVLLQLLHVALELGPPVLEPANNLKKSDIFYFLFLRIFLWKTYICTKINCLLFSLQNFAANVPS